MITEQQKQFMEDNRPHYDTLIRADFLTNIGQDVKNGLLEVARVFAPAYQANLWCGPCVCELVKYAYTQYDKWVSEQPKEDIKEVEAPVIMKATFPKQDKPKTAVKRGRKAKAK